MWHVNTDMKYKIEIEKLSKLPYFDIVTIGNLLTTTGQNLLMFTTRAVARGQLVRLKRGIYVTSEYFNNKKTNPYYLEFLSNKIYGPSYVSSSYVLQKNAVLTESVYALTAITIKKTAKVINNAGNFLYTNISKDLFTGFEIIERDGYQIQEATLAKALYDYLFFTVKPWKTITTERIEGLRLNLDDLSEDSWNEFRGYVDEFKSKKMRKIKKIICNQ